MALTAGCLAQKERGPRRLSLAPCAQCLRLCHLRRCMLLTYSTWELRPQKGGRPLSVKESWHWGCSSSFLPRESRRRIPRTTFAGDLDTRRPSSTTSFTLTADMSTMPTFRRMRPTTQVSPKTWPEYQWRWPWLTTMKDTWLGYHDLDKPLNGAADFSISLNKNDRQVNFSNEGPQS